MHPWAKKSVKKCNNYDEAELFASKAKINVFLKIFRMDQGLQRGPGVKKKFQKMLIFVFEVIVQQPKHTFEIGIFFASYLIVHSVI